MKHIDRLVIKARKQAYATAERIITAFVYRDNGHWVAQGNLWCGVPGKGFRTATCECLTMDEAIEAVHELADQFPNKHQDIQIIIDDLDE